MPRIVLNTLSLLVICLYLIIGSAFIFTDFLVSHLQENRTLVGIVLIVYGLFRAARFYLKNRTLDK